ncbi:glutaredoxin family protein [Marinomonas algicola]|uniref:glutaredoxin family protein n=1 Tax=Marinomonas algicola TaxID=2773454 RepID=UPI00174ADF44|nr:glutaredoxin family protein [Marinomonas algicola]
MNKVVILYGTLGCHLCDIAKQEVVNVTKNRVIIESVDIADDLYLFEKYGTKIPVLEIYGTFLFWPFTSDQVDQALDNAAQVVNKPNRRYLR